MRAFLEAVIKYTNASQVNVIGHSMGVTIGRKIVKGGSATDQKDGTYDVGPSLSSKVKTFIGLAGANLGLTACWNLGTIPTCSNIDGFNPGALATSGPSKFMSELNSNSAREGNTVYTIWSKNDDLIQAQCVVWGKVTCRINNQQTEVVKSGLEWTHFAVRDKTGSDLLGWLWSIIIVSIALSLVIFKCWLPSVDTSKNEHHFQCTPLSPPPFNEDNKAVSGEATGKRNRGGEVCRGTREEAL